MNPISGRRVHESESFHDFSQTLVYPEPVYEKSDHLYFIVFGVWDGHLYECV